MWSAGLPGSANRSSHVTSSSANFAPAVSFPCGRWPAAMTRRGAWSKPPANGVTLTAASLSPKAPSNSNTPRKASGWSRRKTVNASTAAATHWVGCNKAATVANASTNKASIRQGFRHETVGPQASRCAAPCEVQTFQNQRCGCYLTSPPKWVKSTPKPGGQATWIVTVPSAPATSLCHCVVCTAADRASGSCAPAKIPRYPP